MEDGSTNIRVGVIMAGGSGERFWPLSRRRKPKQLLRLTSETETMLHEAVSRLAPLIPPERVLIVTGEHLLDPIREAGIGVPDENIIAEPCKRNTSGALAYAAAQMLARYGGDGSNLTMAVTTADHTIGDSDLFRSTIRAAMEAAERDGALATMGVVPIRPETGYGYIQIDDGPSLSAQDQTIRVHRVSAFHEKPNRKQAEDFIATGRFFWNSGMFFWTVAAFLAELDAERPSLSQAVRDMAKAMQDGNTGRVRATFEALENVSIDYALMEHAGHVIMARAEFPWDDVGAWPALDRTYSKDDHENVTVGDPVLIDTENTIVYNDRGDNVAVGVVGVEDLVVVVTDDAVLVIPKDRAQDVRHIVTALKERGDRFV